MTRTIKVALGDIHAGKNIALLNPDTQIIEEDAHGNQYIYKPHLTATQEHLWGVFLDACDEIDRIAKKDIIDIALMGDLTDGGRWSQGNNQDTVYDQVMVGYQALLPLVTKKNVRSIRIMFGTEVHTWGPGGGEKFIRDYFKSQLPKVDIKAGTHFHMKINGIDWDEAHHGSSAGIRAWTRGNVIRHELRSAMMTEISRGKKPPNVYLRGHFHSYLRERVDVDKYTSNYYLVPSMCMPNPHAIKITKSIPLVTNGVCVYETIDGRLKDDYHDNPKLRATIDIRTREIIK